MSEIGGDPCGDLQPGDENLPLATGASDPAFYCCGPGEACESVDCTGTPEASEPAGAYSALRGVIGTAAPSQTLEEAAALLQGDPTMPRAGWTQSDNGREQTEAGK